VAAAQVTTSIILKVLAVLVVVGGAHQEILLILHKQELPTLVGAEAPRQTFQVLQAVPVSSSFVTHKI
jgi:hypothetical protein